MLRGYINAAVCQAFPYSNPPPSLSKEVYLFFVASVDIYISSKLQVGLEFKLSRIHQASVMPPIPCHPPHPPHPHPPLPGRCMRRGVVLSQGLTRLTALTRNLHLRENIFPFYENIAQFCHKNSMGYVIVAWMDLATMSWVLSEGRHLCAWPISPSLLVCTKYSMKQQRWSVHNQRL